MCFRIQHIKCLYVCVCVIKVELIKFHKPLNLCYTEETFFTVPTCLVYELRIKTSLVLHQEMWLYQGKESFNLP